MLKHVDFLASNVPGFDAAVYVGGARLEAFYPFGPTLGSAANVTLMSYRGTCNIGINTDAGAVPDPEVFPAASAKDSTRSSRSPTRHTDQRAGRSRDG